ncbi:MAG: HD domain-containing phosphohydrolase [Burkholderiaceae bacterium]
MSSFPAVSPAARRRIPLQVLLSLLLGAVVLCSGGAVGGIAWWEARALMLEAADQAFGDAARTTENALHDVLEPVASQLESIALPAARPEAGGRALPFLHQLLRSQVQVDAAYVGDDDGHFILLRPTPAAADRARFGAPEATRYLAQAVRAGERTDIRFDGSLVEIDRAPPVASSFDPRSRPWFAVAAVPGQRAMSEPYVFTATGEAGITLAVRSASGQVLGADLSLARLSALLGGLRSTPSMRILLLDRDGQVLARARAEESRTRQDGGKVRLTRIAGFDDPVLAAVAALPVSSSTRRLEIGGHDWQAALLPLRFGSRELRLAIAAPVSELVAGATAIRNRSLLMAALVLVLGLALAIGIARQITRRLARLTDEAQAVRAFDFGGAPWPGSVARELDQLGEAMDLMRRTIRRFLEITASLASERRLDHLVERVARESSAAADATAVAVWLPDAHGRRLVAAGAQAAAAEIDLHGDSPEARAWASGERVIASVAGTTRIALPLTEREGERVGVLALSLAGSEAPGAARLAFVEQLAGASAVAIETRRLLDERKALLESFIRVLAGAIDAKSAYTGAHCQRVPELTLMLARAACAATEGPLAGYSLDETQWEALEIASWLHDCGKVTTPEYVVDKATKLETIYDRIHEVRMRFEVLKRDAEIDHLRRVAGGADVAASEAQWAAESAALDADYTFVASCNPGGECLAPEAAARLRAIGARRWLRTLDDTLGLSREEAARREPQPLPVAEALLADKPEHRVRRVTPDAAAQALADRLGLRMVAPALAYDRGELKNLTVSRGTLTEEDRYVINHHIVQTLVMLAQLPLPRHLTEVPEIAGGHHEKMDGTGYPRGLRREQMSWPARMMAIADVFEALTASDRPYKAGKTVGESLSIMARMSREGHIDPDLFELFLRAGVWRDYAERFLRPEQIDTPEIEFLLDKASAQTPRFS